MKQKDLAYYLTYQFIPKSSSEYQFPKSFNPRNTFQQSEKWITAKLYDVLDNIIKTSLGGSTQPVGLLLSGGVDSAILLYLLRKNTSRKIYTISGAYSSHQAHLKICSYLAKKYATDHLELIISPSDLLKLRDLYSSRFENPIGDNGFLATHLMFKTLSSRTSTIYTGDGADCLFHGLKAHHLHILERGYLNRTRQNQKSSTIVREKLLLPTTNYPDYEHYKYDEIFLTKNEAAHYLDIHFDLAKPLKAMLNIIRSDDPIKKTILLDLNFLVVNRIDYILNAAAANKIKPVFPYLDKTLVYFALRISSEYFIKNDQQKYILKKAFNDKLPKQIISQRKRGMTPPFLEWYTANRYFVLKTLKQAQKLCISQQYIQYLIKHMNCSNQYAYGMRIWLLINLVLWHAGHNATSKK